MSEQIDTNIQDFKIKPIKQEHKYKRFPKQCKEFMEESENSQCPYCEMNYKDKYIMHTHLYRVHQKYPYRCTECFKTFPKIRLLKLHIESEHLNLRKKENKIKKSQNLDSSNSKVSIINNSKINNSINLNNLGSDNINVCMSRSQNLNSQQLISLQEQQNLNQKGIEGSQMLQSKISLINNNNNKMQMSKFSMNESLMNDLLPICEQVSEEADIDVGEIRKQQNNQNKIQFQNYQKIFQGNLDTNPLSNAVSNSIKTSIIINNNQICSKTSEDGNKMSQSKLMERSTLSINQFNQDNMDENQMRRSKSKVTRSQLLFKLARQKQGYNDNNKYQELYKQECKDLDFKRFEPSKQLYRKKRQSTIFDDLNLMTRSLNSDDRCKMESSFDLKYWQPQKKVMTEEMVSVSCLLK